MGMGVWGGKELVLCIVCNSKNFVYLIKVPEISFCVFEWYSLGFLLYVIAEKIILLFFLLAILF